MFREVAGDHASFFKGRTPDALAEAIAEGLKLRAQNRQPTSEGMPWVTWAQSADRLKAILLEGDWYKVWPSDDRGPGIRNGDDRTTPAGGADACFQRPVAAAGGTPLLRRQRAIQ